MLDCLPTATTSTVFVGVVDLPALGAQEDRAQARGEGGDKLAAVLKLESELQALREHTAQHEAELRQELQQARRDKQQAEAKLAGLDLTQMEVGCLSQSTTSDCTQCKGVGVPCLPVGLDLTQMQVGCITGPPLVAKRVQLVSVSVSASVSVFVAVLLGTQTCN